MVLDIRKEKHSVASGCIKLVCRRAKMRRRRDGGALRRISLRHLECSKHREWSQNRGLPNRNEPKEM